MVPGSMDRTRVLAVSVVALFVVSSVVVIFVESSSHNAESQELLSPLEVGRYAVRAERQSSDYDQKAERQIAFATDNDDAASAERDLAAKEESRARDSAYLAADMKSTIDKVLEEGRDQVNQATKLKAKAGRLQEMAAELLDKAKTEKESAAALKAAYYKTMDEYSAAVTKIDTATQGAQKILDQMNKQSLILAQDPNAPAAVALRKQLQAAQQDLSAITAQKAKADSDTAEARQLADKFQPMIIDAEKKKEESDFHFQEFAQETSQADQLQKRADALLARSDTIDGLIQNTQSELAEKRKDFEHYKNRAQTEMAISLQAEDKEALLRKQARQARFKAAELSDKGRRLRALAQKGVNNVMEATENSA